MGGGDSVFDPTQRPASGRQSAGWLNADDCSESIGRSDRTGQIMATSPKTGDLELGRKISYRREELGMSRKQLAEAINLSYAYVAQIETGYRLPSTKHQVLLARVLGMSLDELFGTEDELPRASVRAQSSVSSRTRLPSIDEAIEHAAQEIEALPPSVRPEALSAAQLRIMQSVAEDQSRPPP